MFSNLTTRRLGTRGQSRYHYYGLAVLPDSIYYSPNYSCRKLPDHPPAEYRQKARKRTKNLFKSTIKLKSQNLQTLLSPRNEEIYETNNGEAFSHSPTNLSSGVPLSSSSCSSSFASIQQLPDFPSFRDFDRSSSSSGLPSDKLQTLLTMYRAHCQRIMDSVNKFSFSEIPHLFTHFWQEIPPHISGLLGQNAVVTLIGICDAILYRTIMKAVLPTATQMFSENVLKIVRKFADDIVVSLHYSLKQVPDNLVYVKMKRKGFSCETNSASSLKAHF